MLSRVCLQIISRYDQEHEFYQPPMHCTQTNNVINFAKQKNENQRNCFDSNTRTLNIVLVSSKHNESCHKHIHL